MTIAIRQAVAADLDAVAALWDELTACHHGLDPQHWRRAPDGVARFRDWMEEALADTQRRALLIAEAEGAVGAFVHAQVRASPPPMQPRRSVFMTDLAVAAPLRRRGIGRRLVAAVEAWSTQRGCDDVGLTVSQRNAAGAAFWLALGYEAWLATLWKPLREPALAATAAPVIVAATAADAPALFALMVAATTVGCASHYPADILRIWHHGRTAEGMAGVIAGGGVHVLRVDGAARGFAHIVGSELVGLMVHPDDHGRGHGAALFRHAAAVIATRPLVVRATLNAVGFYERMGCRRRGLEVVRRHERDIYVELMELS